MHKLEKRIAALEAAKPADPFHAIRLEAGETVADARLRCGVSADAANVLFIQRVIISPTKDQYAEH